PRPARAPRGRRQQGSHPMGRGNLPARVERRPCRRRGSRGGRRLMARIEVIDQTLRDGQQSYWGMRMRAGQILPVAAAIDSAGYRVVDLTGSSIFEVMVRYRQENPWKGLDAIRAALPNSTLRAGTRTNRIVGMNVTPDSIVELWIRTLAQHGIESLWIFDCLHDAENRSRLTKIAPAAGLAPSPQLIFSEPPVHTDDYYADVIDRMIAGD